MANPRPHVKKGLYSALFYTPLAGLHRTNSPATPLQQPVAPRNKSSQHTLLCTPVAERIRPIYASHMPLRRCMQREIATVGFRECLLAEAQAASVLCSIMRIVWGWLHKTKLDFREARLSETGRIEARHPLVKIAAKCQK